MGRTVTVRGADAGNRFAGEGLCELALPVVVGKARDRDEVGLGVAQQVIDVPVADRPLPAGEFAVAVDSREAAGPEGAADVGVRPLEAVLADGADLEFDRGGVDLEDVRTTSHRSSIVGESE